MVKQLSHLFHNAINLFFQMRAYLADVIRELPIGPDQHRISMMKYSDDVQVKCIANCIVLFKIVGVVKV